MMSASSVTTPFHGAEQDQVCKVTYLYKEKTLTSPRTNEQNSRLRIASKAYAATLPRRKERKQKMKSPKSEPSVKPDALLGSVARKSRSSHPDPDPYYPYSHSLRVKHERTYLHTPNKRMHGDLPYGQNQRLSKPKEHTIDESLGVSNMPLRLRSSSQLQNFMTPNKIKPNERMSIAQHTKIGSSLLDIKSDSMFPRPTEAHVSHNQNVDDPSATTEHDYTKYLRLPKAPGPSTSDKKKNGSARKAKDAKRVRFPKTVATPTSTGLSAKRNSTNLTSASEDTAREKTSDLFTKQRNRRYSPTVVSFKATPLVRTSSNIDMQTNVTKPKRGNAKETLSDIKLPQVASRSSLTSLRSIKSSELLLALHPDPHRVVKVEK